MMNFEKYNLPSYSVVALRRYVEQGIEPGGFMQALLCNDLMGACARADFQNQRCIFEWVMCLVNEIPSAAWGGCDQYREWLKRKREEAQRDE